MRFPLYILAVLAIWGLAALVSVGLGAAFGPTVVGSSLEMIELPTGEVIPVHDPVESIDDAIRQLLLTALAAIAAPAVGILAGALSVGAGRIPHEQREARIAQWGLRTLALGSILFAFAHVMETIRGSVSWGSHYDVGFLIATPGVATATILMAIAVSREARSNKKEASILQD